ncbi:MAG: hypothetical protein M1830_002513 [Pleopsidium flavum]|nr:MAG: hypothetical protein M1830_002513 [Pleopsidium flavum]
MSSSTEQYSTLRPVTRHITTNDPTGTAQIHASTPGQWQRIGPHLAINTIYSTSTSPPSLTDNTDITTHEQAISSGTLGLAQPHGTVCSIVELGPGNTAPHMHRTQSLDYGVVVAGEVELLLDGGEKRVLGAGDVVVQRATMHAWRNPSETEWARMMFVLVGCEKLVVWGKEMGQDLGSKEKELTHISGSTS